MNVSYMRRAYEPSRERPLIAGAFHRDMPLHMPLAHIRRAFHGRKLQAALIGHPIFRLPHDVCASQPNESQLAENFAYFQSQAVSRPHHLDFLLSQFEADAFDEASLDDWVATFGQMLVPSVAQVNALQNGNIYWTGELAGLNVVLAIAITLGDQAIRRGTGWRWEADAAARGSNAMLVASERRCDLVKEVAVCCLNARRDGAGLGLLRARLSAD